MILQGEGLYSKNRMRSLQDEWISDYPTLVDCTALRKAEAQRIPAKLNPARAG